MKIAVLSGAVKNAGDYLITNRAVKLLQSVYPSAEIRVYPRNSPLSEELLDEINTADMAVLAGGPLYKYDLYPQTVPLTAELSRIRPKLAIVGGGWYGNTSSEKEWKAYDFSPDTLRLFERIQRDGGFFGCRDNYAVKVLKQNGFDSGVMTGCPAWYDPDCIGKTLDYPREIRRIAVSDPADIVHFGNQSLEVVKRLKARYPQADIEYVFHRGTTEEDSRGAGVNEAVGLVSIRGYLRRRARKAPLWQKVYDKVFDYTKLNPACADEVEKALDELERTEGAAYHAAFATMKDYYRIMRHYLESLETLCFGQPVCTSF